MKKIILLISSSIILAGLWVGVPALLEWQNYNETLSEISKQNKINKKLVLYKLKEVKSYTDYLAVDELELEQSKKLFQKFKNTPFDDIKYRLQTRVNVNELIWKLSNEKILLRAFSKDIVNKQPGEFVNDLENIHKETQNAFKHYSESQEFIKQKREELSNELQKQNLTKEQRVELWSYIDSRTSYLNQSMEEMKYRNIAHYLRLVLNLQEFLIEQKSESLRTEDGKILLNSLDARLKFSSLVSDIRLASIDLVL